jgi:AbrB family looped-hinge helix DNA binding protein
MMMAERAFVTLSSKNQIVIPAPVRQLLDLQAGDRLEFDYEPGRVVIKKAQPTVDPYLQATDQVFSEEWNSVEDARFDDLL